MTFTEIKTLLDAGFSKDEIMSLEQTGEVTRIVSDPVPAPADDPVPDPAPADDPVPDQAQAVPDPIFTQLNENIGKLIKTIQSSNLANNSVEKPGGVDLNKTVDSIMESIIRPTKGGN